MPKRPERPLQKAAPFNEDALIHGGYLYSTNASCSSRLANARISAAVFDLVDLAGKHVIDIGCGDGTYTMTLLDEGQPFRLHASDLAIEAVRVARRHPDVSAITLDAASAYRLPFANDSFDLAHLRGVLHHMDQPELALQEALRVARQVVVVEPNGNNLGLKLIERLSPYHRAHQEKSYSSRTLNRWIRLAGGVVTAATWTGLVPMFCPDWVARAAKRAEPHIEASRTLARLACAVYVFVAERPGTPSGGRP